LVENHFIEGKHMGSLVAAVSASVASADAATGKAGTPGGADGFLSLLTIGIDKDKAKSSGIADELLVRSPQQDTPAAALVDAVAPLAIAPKTESANEKFSDVTARNDVAPRAKEEKLAAPDKPSDRLTADTRRAPLEIKKSELRVADKENKQLTAIEPQEEEVRDELKKQLGTIGDILQSIIQLLSGKVAAPQVADAPADAPVETAAITDTPGLALLKDVAALLPQIQKALEVSSTPQDVFSSLQQGQAGNTNLQQLTELLQKDLSQLAQLLTPAPGDTAPVSLASLLPDSTPLDATQLQELTAKLKTNIGQAREQLQQISSANETVFASAKNQFHAAAPDIAQVFDQALAGSGVVVKNIVKDVTKDDSKTTVAAAPAAAAAVAAAPVITVSATQASAVAAAVTTAQQATIENNGAESHGGGNNARQQGTATQPLTGGAASSRPADTASDSTFAKALNKASATPILQQVAFQIKTAAADGSSKINIQLNPEELGKLEIRIHVGADGKTGVTVTADNKDTLSLLQRDSSGLSRALQDAGLQTDSGSLSFNLRGGQQEQQGQGGNQQAASTYQKFQPEEEADAAINVITRSYVVNLADGLDIQI